jgi:thioredoxin-like negative regulator of GroEL
VWFAVRWQLGNMFAELTSLNQPDARQVSELAVRLAPRDPLAHWLRASKVKEEFSVESLEASVRMLEDVVRLSPHDFRWWIELGRAYEQAERPEEAERALTQAVSLAPEYTFPRWQLGNFYLRQGRTEEAFAELMKTTEKSGVYREQVFSLAWDYFDKDPASVEAVASDAPDIRASLAMFFAARGAAADALRNWNMLSEEQKAADPQLPRIMAQGLYDRGEYREAVEFARQSGMDPEAGLDTITNPGFEKFIGSDDATLFGWRIRRGNNRIDMMPDSGVKREGERSLRVSFRGFADTELYNVSQVVPVEPNAPYRLSFWVRTEDLRSGGPPLIRVGNLNDNQVLGSSAPFDSAMADWQQVAIDFVTPEDCEGIAIWTARAYCGEGCPITGTLWYDGFSLSRR